MFQTQTRRMTRPLTRRPYVLRGIAPFLAVLTLLIAIAALAQMPGARGAERGPTSHLQRKRLRARQMDPGAPLFLLAATYNSGGLAFCVVVADVNGDSKPDLVVGNSDHAGSVGVLLGNGDGTFRAAVTYGSGGSFANSLAVADVNGDGEVDILVADTDSSVVGVLLGNGDGTFQTAVTYRTNGTDALSIAVADVNGDGKPDLLVANEDGGAGDVVDVLLGNGDGTFKPAVTYSSGGFLPTSIAVSDVNGDGRPDLMVTNDCSIGGPCVGEGSVGVLLGNGDGTFQSAVAYDSGGDGATSVLVADVNGDGKRDLVVANCAPSGSTSCGGVGNLISVLLGNGNGTFQPAVTYDSGGDFPTSLAFMDVNGDGKRDLLVANFGSAGVLLGNGDGTFQPPQTYGLGGVPGLSIAVADVNGDGRPDLLVANGQITMLLNIDAPATTTALISNMNPVAQNQTVTYTASVKSQFGGAVTGTIMFQQDGSPIAAVALVGAQAAYSTSYGQTGGNHIIVATYLGDKHNSASISNTLLEYIGCCYGTATALSTSGSPSFVGQPVTFTASVFPVVGMVQDGELVTFYDAKIAIGTGSTVSGVATFTTASLTLKTHTVKAIYPGDAVFRSSTGKVKQVVEKYPTTASLMSSLNPSKFKQQVTFTAQVTSSGPTPTGKVKFLDGTTPLGTVTLSNGSASVTKSRLAVGTHPITAQYLGDALADGSTSPVVNQVVQ